MTNLDSILRSRNITLLTKFCLVKGMVFPVVMYGCESWTVKKPEDRRIDAFEVWCWRRLLRVPWTARRSKQSILKEINSDYRPQSKLTGVLQEEEIRTQTSGDTTEGPQGEGAAGACLSAREGRETRRTQPCQHPDLGFPASRTMRKYTVAIRSSSPRKPVEASYP